MKYSNLSGFNKWSAILRDESHFLDQIRNDLLCSGIVRRDWDRLSTRISEGQGISGHNVEGFDDGNP